MFYFSIFLYTLQKNLLAECFPFDDIQLQIFSSCWYFGKYKHIETLSNKNPHRISPSVIEFFIYQKLETYRKHIVNKCKHIVNLNKVGRYSGRFPLTQKVCQIFFIAIIMPGIFLSPFKTSRRQNNEENFTGYTPLQLQKSLPGLTVSFRGFHLFFLRILYLSRKLVRKVHIGTLLLISRNGIQLCFLPGIPLPFLSIFEP